MAPAQTFHDHIRELRRRLLWIVLAIGISGGISYVLRVKVIRLLQRPLGATLFYTSPAGSFNFILKLSTLIGLFIALPVIIYQLVRFIEPALPVNIKKRVMATVISASFALALLGIAFSYLYMIPMSLKFFAGYSTDQIKPLISANEYLSYMLGNLIIFALVFQIPLIVLFINWIKPMKPTKLLRYQRHVIVGAFGLAIVLPFTYDPISQFIVAIPIIVLFYLSVGLLWAANRGRIYKGEVPKTVPIMAASPIPAVVTDMPRPLLAPPPVLATHQPIITTDGFMASANEFKARVARQDPAPVSGLSAPLAKPPMTILRRPRLSIDGIS